jgi:dihydroorotate dehydrogenase electron transfer subunit
MLKRTHTSIILYKQEIAPHVFDMWVSCSGIGSTAVPGQFIHVKCSDGVLLRRPFAICDVSEGKIRFVFEVKGEGTKILAAKHKGEAVNILGELGNGFTLSERYQHPLVIGGGIGTFPLLFLSRRLNKPDAILGFRDKSQVILEGDFARKCNKVRVATDDGSYGHHGNAVALAREKITSYDILYACGPTPMLKAVADLAGVYGIPCQVSLEARMGCGIGACLVCACAINGQYKHVCKDGPVFWSDEVNFDG